MRSDAPIAGSDASGAYRRRLVEAATPHLLGGERILALLPFASVPKLPRVPRHRGQARPEKVRVGIRQSWRRYRPLVVTGRRLLVFDSGRTPNPRELLTTFPIEEVEIGAITTARFGVSQFSLTLPGLGDVPFETGRREALDLARFTELLVSPKRRSRAR